MGRTRVEDYSRGLLSCVRPRAYPGRAVPPVLSEAGKSGPSGSGKSEGRGDPKRDAWRWGTFAGGGIHDGLNHRQAAAQPSNSPTGTGSKFLAGHAQKAGANHRSPPPRMVLRPDASDPPNARQAVWEPLHFAQHDARRLPRHEFSRAFPSSAHVARIAHQPAAARDPQQPVGTRRFHLL